MTVRPAPSSTAASRRMRITRRRDTPGELAIRSRLHNLGYRFRVDVSPIAGRRSRADIVFPRRQLAVYIDGCFWHGCPDHGTWPKANADWWRSKIEANRQRDQTTDAEMLVFGWRVVRIWTHESSDSATQRVIDALRQANSTKRPEPKLERPDQPSERRDAPVNRLFEVPVRGSERPQLAQGA